MPTGAHTCASPAPSGRGPAGLGRSPASHSCCHTRPQPPPRIGTSNTFGQRLKTCHKGFCRMHAPWKRFISPVFTSHARTLLKSLLVQRAGHGASLLPYAPHPAVPKGAPLAGAVPGAGAQRSLWRPRGGGHFLGRGASGSTEFEMRRPAPGSGHAIPLGMRRGGVSSPAAPPCRWPGAAQRTGRPAEAGGASVLGSPLPLPSGAF